MVEVSVERGSRARTRRAILDAAITVLGSTPTATLAEIAQAADVGRTTLHRYFAERSDLLQALSAEGASRIAEADRRARLSDGTGIEALRRLCREYFALGDMALVVYNQPQFAAYADWSQATAIDPTVQAAIERGHADGTIDAASPVLWVQSILWSILYSGWAHVTEQGLPPLDALDLVLRTLDGAIGSRAARHATPD